MGQSTFDKSTTQVKSVSGAPVNADRRFVLKGGLALSIMAFGRLSHLRLRRKAWLRTCRVRCVT